MNAFVAGGQTIFLHSGMITRLETVDQLRAVIAHEVGHITGGHVARRDQALRGARGVAALGMIGALAATAGGAPQAGIAIGLGGQQAAQRSALAHSRQEEAAADQAGLRFMAGAGARPAAALEVMRIFRGQEALLSRRQDAYARTHPLFAERMALIEDRVAQLPPGEPPSAADVYWHARMIAKFNAFLDNPQDTLRRHASGGGEFSVMSRAIAHHRRANAREAIAHADALIRARPDDAFYHELKGQFLLEGGQAGAGGQRYRAAVRLAPNEPLILGGLGRALLNMDESGTLREARDALARSLHLDRANSAVLRDLALAHARLGDEGLAALATAERYALEGRFADALRIAERAAGLLPRGSAGWLQAQDVITGARRALN
jgi:predicted Zn-dependent protease